ncbi:hypothetical protein MLD52_18565 [Puniceicoccaceae bacterium K14]|nr:hypothetical protein [Puniceicoccaceae bacterium K14]
MAITDWFQNVTERYKYDAFGGAHIYDGNWNARSSSVVSNRYQYTGQEWWPEMGLHNYKARFYSSELGCFIQQDPCASMQWA